MLRLGRTSLRTLGQRVLRYGTQVESSFMKVYKDEHTPKLQQLLPRPQYGGESIVTLLAGSTIIGQQGERFITTLFKTSKVPVCFEHVALGADDKANPIEYVYSVMRNRTAIHVDLQYDPEDKAKSVRLNNVLDLYACVVNVNSFEGYRSKAPDVDIMLAVQNNTGDFTKLEYEPVPGVVETIRNCEFAAMRRYLEFAFKYAVQHDRKRITIGHKNSELPLSDGKFLEIAYELQEKQYPELELEEMSIDALVRYIIMSPQDFDMVCTNDRYGTVLLSVCSAVCGGAELFSAVELGDHHAVFKPLQTKLSVTDCRQLSPYGIVRACIDLLRHLGKCECADLLWEELLNTMMVRKIKTREFGGKDKNEFVICDILNNLNCKFK